MTPSEVVAVSVLLENSSPCKQQCKLDVWRERCVSCHRTIEQIQQAGLARSKVSTN
jgi:predicted Fe-S protein YdhL (DUF1289 family)